MQRCGESSKEQTGILFLPRKAHPSGMGQTVDKVDSGK
jgi:hypothetical protein